MSETYFSQQDLIFGIPEKYESEFKERNGFGPEMDFDVDGDGWQLLADWVSDLNKENEKLKAVLLYAQKECTYNEPSLSVLQRMIDEALTNTGE